MTGLLGDFLAFLGGGDRALLALAPRERPRFVTMGLVLLTTAGFAALSMFYALHDGIQVDLAPSLILCLIWGLVILNLDRFLITTMGAVRGITRLALLSLPRLVLSAVIGVVITTPLVLRIFSPDIDRQLVIMNASQPHVANNGLLAQVQALSQLSSSNTVVAVAVDVTFLLFFLILMMPVTTKVLLNLGPPSAYEQVARHKDEQAIDMVRAARIGSRRIEEENTVARLRIEELKAQTRLAIEQDMRQKEEDLGRRANNHVARQMEAILDAALQEWSNQVRATLATSEKSQAPDPGMLPPFQPHWPSSSSPQPEARPEYDMPPGGEL